MKTNKAVKIAGWTLGTLVALIVILIVFILTFDWNRAKPYINRKVSESTGRDFAINGDLQVHWKRGEDTERGWRRFVPRPFVSAQDIHMSNPEWSTVGKQMAQAKRVDVAFHLLPLLHKEVVLTDLRLEAPQIALQRRADGTNTWTLKDNGPSEWDYDIQRLAFAGGKLRYLDEGIKLDLHADAQSIEGAPTTATPAANGQPAVQPYGIEFKLGGTYNKAPVTGGGKAGAVLSLTDEHTRYPVEAHAVSGNNKVAVNGTLNDPRSLNGIDLNLTLGADSMADLYALTGVLLPQTPPFQTKGRLLGRKDGDVWNWKYDKFTGKVGESDIAGTMEYLPRKPRPLLRGELTSQQVRLADLGPTVGADTGAGTKAAGKVKKPAEGKALPVDQFNTAKWGALDADVKFTGKKIVRANDIPLQNIKADIHMKDKVLTLTPLNFGLAGGQITSNISLDGRDKVIDAKARVAARHIKIRELFPKLQSMQASFGEINGDMAIAGKGNSVSTMLATSNGEASAVVTEGSVSSFLLEIAGLNVANAVYAKLFGDKQVHLNCLATNMDVRNGRANIDRFVLDTDDAVIGVTGYVDLAQESLDVDVRPKSKGTRIFSLRTPLYAKGTFADPKVGPHAGPLALKAGAAVALAAINPLAAILPLVNVDKAPDTNCGAEISRAEKTPQMRETPKKPVAKK
ncbi:hypothetical protein IP91_00562 [Pseudoduganella lurida]|uniref:AsmA domain-containing protein n=1 Tax=Pseudoduganella lurida TaxID=1036180 RepID=A0A562RKP3_9BURK|nr:AsmA family protein [Pseudoduganella lurida]TWI69493.1 hypothetical protein IP91_00562 [Pseudoduganella lurida]